jgi:VWFA-related protein
MSRGTTGFVCLLVLNFGAAGGWAQVSIQPRIAPGARRTTPPNLRVNTSLVLVPVSVTDALNRPVLGLDKGSFRIFDNNVEQQVASLAFEDTPVAIAVVFDMSGSMRPKMRKSRLALARLLQAANPEDEFCLIEFSDSVHLAKRWTSDPAEITGALDAVPRGRTALLDAIALGLSEVKKSTKPRKAIVIVSDGGDNRSRLTETEVRTMARESDALIYAMGIFEGMGIQLSLEELAGPGLLEEITEASGGRLFPVSDVNRLPEIAARIGVELHNQYVLAYSPSAMQHDGRHHRVRVQVAPPAGISALNIDWRAGYRAPIQ